MKQLFSVLAAGFLFGNAFAQKPSSPDLKIWNHHVLGEQIIPGVPFKTFVTVGNDGKGQAKTPDLGYFLSKDDKLDASDLFLGESYLSSLKAGEFDSVFAELKLPGELGDGTYHLFFHADYTGKIEESDELNNIASSAVRISTSPKADLTVEQFHAYPTEVVPGGLFNGSVLLTNTNGLPVPSQTVGYYLSQDSILDNSDLVVGKDFFNGSDSSSGGWLAAQFQLPADLSVGRYFIFAKADYANQIMETSEDNNARSLLISVVAPYAEIRNLGLYPNREVVIPGSTLTCFYSVINTGTTDVPVLQTGFFLSADSNYTSDDQLIGTANMRLGTGVYSSGDTFSLRIPENLPYGEYYIISHNDYRNEISEPNEADNTSMTRILVKPTDIDLGIYNTALYPFNVTHGTRATLTAVEFNHGSSPVRTNTIAYLVSRDSVADNSDYLLAVSRTGEILPQSYYSDVQSVIIPDSLPFGTYTLIAVADYQDTVQEGNEENNLAYAQFRISPAGKDLTMRLYADSNARYSPGSYVSLNVSEQNEGTSDASFHHNGYYLSNDAQLDSNDLLVISDSVFALNASSSAYYQYNLYLPTDLAPGQYYVIAAADIHNNVEETNESNNEAFAVINVVRPSVDLVPQFITTDTLFAKAGESIYLSLLELNKGTTPAYGHYTGFYLSRDVIKDSADIELGNSYVYYVREGGSELLNPVVQLPAGIGEGYYFILAQSDIYNHIAEEDEANNTAVLQTVIRASASELIVSDLKVSVPSVAPGNNFSASLLDWNIGKEYAGQHYVGYYISKDSVYSGDDINLGQEFVYEVKEESFVSLNPVLNMPYYIYPGDYYLIAVSDIYGQVSESNEYNNYQAVKLNVARNTVDLKISALSAENLNPSAGSFIYVKAEELNSGNLDAGNHHIGYFLSADPVFDESDLYLATNFLATLRAGRSVELNPALYIPSSVIDGNYYLLSVADYSNAVYEDDEFNNTAALAITVGNPAGSEEVDLAVTGFTVNSPVVTAGSWAFVHLKEANFGKGLAGKHRIGYYLSADSAISWDDKFLRESFVNELPAGGGFSDSANIYFYEEGKYYLLAVLDDLNEVSEINEYNNIAAVRIVVDGTLGVVENRIETQEISMFPNPSNGIVTFSDLKNADQVEIADAQGQVLLTVNVSTIESKTVDLSSFHTGVYFVRVKKGGAVTSQSTLMLNR